MSELDLYTRARRLDPAAIEQLLGEVYPSVYRITCGLTGSEATGRKLTRNLMHRGMQQVERWRHEGDARRWFHHHAVLLARRSAAARSSPADDALVTASAGATPDDVAFVVALRKLQHQAREAVLLHHAEGLEARSLAVAMDCSTEAASNHLTAGRRELATVVGARLNHLLARTGAAYQRLTPDEHLMLPLMKTMVRRHVWPRRIARWTARVTAVCLLLAIAYFAWRYGRTLDY